ncbi:MAG: 23S rRNA (uracil(1939)-C(5))-methyltransferase RlmD [Candidatus Hydrogenedentes bacterium]|nr:23S rRNA (uracil(1939)-C(5))-methyltransferase RlmD [Candidatus Hydrogenedentota bacterium]
MSPHRTTDTNALCPHFWICGGCASQDILYPEQLELKSAAIEELFSPYWDRRVETIASPAIWQYRNKVDLNFVRKRYDEPPPKDFVKETVLGFTRKGKWYWPLLVDECLIGPAGLGALLAAVRGWQQDVGLRAFDSRTRDGLLRALLVREGRRTGQKMVALITADGPIETGSFVEAVKGAFEATSIHRGVFHGLSQGSFADTLELLDGDKTIEEELRVPDGNGERRLRFQISPMSFFQTNTLGAEVLYGLIREWARAVSPRVLYDLYGGAGGIAFSCADLAQVIRSVENVETATADGVANAKRNGIDNVFFSTQKVKNYLLDVLNSGGMEASSAAVLDPPRSGMHPKAVKRLVECRPPRILYVSCNPKVFVRELPAFLEQYALTDMKAVDLFPHTPHVEVLAYMTLR